MPWIFFFKLDLKTNLFFFEIVYFGASTFNPKCLPVANLSLKYTQTLEVHTTFFNAVGVLLYNSIDQRSTSIFT